VCPAQTTSEAPKGQPPNTAESAAPKPAPKVDPKPRIIELLGGEVMFLGFDAIGPGYWRDAEGAASWRNPGVISAVTGRFERDDVVAVEAESGNGSRPSKPPGFQVINRYITPNGKVLSVGIIYREDGSIELPLVLSCGETGLGNRTGVLPLIGGKSAMLVKNNSGPCPIFAGTFADSDIMPSRASSKLPGAESNVVGATCAIMVSEGILCFAPVYRDDGSVDPPHAWGEGIKNQTQVVALIGGESALLLTDSKGADPLLKGIYPADQLHSTSDGILLTEQYLTLEAEVLSLDTLYGPTRPPSFMGGRLGDMPIQNRSQVIKLAGNKSAVFAADPHSTSGVPRFVGIQETQDSPYVVPGVRTIWPFYLFGGFALIFVVVGYVVAKIRGRTPQD